MSHPPKSSSSRISRLPEPFDDASLNAAEERLQLLVDGVTDAAHCILDRDGRVLSWNAGAERLQGWSAEEIVGAECAAFYPAEAASSGKCRRDLERAARIGRVEEEGIRLRKHGRFWASVTLTAIRDPAGQLVGFAQVTRDLSERRAAEEESRRFRLLIESVKDYAIFILDPEGRVTSWNPGAERIKGYRTSEILGRHFSIFYPPESDARARSDRELAIAVEEGRFEEEGFRVRKDGSRFWANVSLTPLRDPDGTLVGFAKLTQDLTERRAAEEEAQRFRLLVEAVKDYAIFILDPKGHVLTWNPGAERIKGYSAREIIGRHFSVFYPEEVKRSGKCDAELEIAEAEGRFEEEGWRLRKDGSRFWASVTITAVRDRDGVLIGFAKVTRDLTERRRREQAERDLAAQRAALAEKSRIQEFQERFVAILGHDLRNPLASIEMGASLLLAGARDPTSQRILERMKSSTRRMSRMIEQILDLTRSRLAGGLEVVFEPMDLREVLVSVVDELRIAHPARAIELASPALVGTWDRDRLEQIFSNLIGNAIGHGDPEAPVTISGTTTPDEIHVAVHNRGQPIPDEMQKTLFDPFRRGDRDSRTAKTAGLGLGLYITSELVRAHGGSIRVDSEERRGTTFHVTLPRDSGASSERRA